MFSDELLDPVSVRSSWRESHLSAQESRSCQTSELLRAEAGLQTGSRTSSWTQTDPQDQEPDQVPQQPQDLLQAPGLRDFLQRVEERMLRELLRNSRSHAFDGFQVNWEEPSQKVSRLHLLRHPAAQERNLHVTCVSWSCTGAGVTCAYGRISDGDWSTNRSYVCMWNLEARDLNPERANLVLDVHTAVTALSCHPQRPALIAGGLYNGEVVAWDASRSDDPVLAQTGMSADGHTEPIYQVAWVPLQRKGDFALLSACSGGRVLLWTLDSEQRRFILTSAFVLLQQQVPRNHSFKLHSGGTVGVTAVSLSPWDPDTFLTGSEGGLLLRCSFSSQMPAAVTPEGPSVPPRAPAVFSFQPSSGPIHAIHCSPFHRNLFVSTGSDGLVHLHSLLQTHPLLSLRASDASVFDVRWSPSRPLVLAAATGRGDVQIFDLGCSALKPAATIEQGAPGHAATCLAFNGQRPQLLAAGATDGTLGVWQLSSDLTEQIAAESSRLEQIAEQVVD